MALVIPIEKEEGQKKEANYRQADVFEQDPVEVSVRGYEQPELEDKGSQSGFKKAKDLKASSDSNRTASLYFARWLFGIFGKCAVFNRMNKAEQGIIK